MSDINLHADTKEEQVELLRHYLLGLCVFGTSQGIVERVSKDFDLRHSEKSQLLQQIDAYRSGPMGTVAEMLYGFIMKQRAEDQANE